MKRTMDEIKESLTEKFGDKDASETMREIYRLIGQNMVAPRDMGKLWDSGLVYNDVDLLLEEDERQREKWGMQCLDILQWLAFISEEVGELAAAISEYIFRDGHARVIIAEAIQASALCLKMAVMVQERLKKGDKGNEKERSKQK